MTAHARPPRRLHRLLALAAVVLGGGYFGGIHVWHVWRFRSAVRAEQLRDFAAAGRALAGCRAYWPDDPEVRLLAARVGWRARLDRPFPPGWDRPVRADLAAAERSAALLDRVGVESQIVDALTGQLARVEAGLARRVAADDPAAVPILEALTRANLDAHRLARARQAADGLIARVPDHALAYFWRGLLGDLAALPAGPVTADFRRAVDLDPGNPTYLIRLADRLAEPAAAPAEALALYDRVLAADPDDPAALAGRANCLYHLGDPGGAAEVFRGLTARRPESGEVWALYGRARLAKGDPPAEVEPVFRRAVGLAPGSVAGNTGLADCLKLVGRPAEAEPFAARAAAARADLARIQELGRRAYADPDLPAAARVELGRLLVRAGNDEIGLFWLRSAAETDPHYEPARAALAEYAAARRKPPQAPR